MTDSTQVCALLKEYTDIDDIAAADLLPLCQRGLDFVVSGLKETADEDDPLIAKTAAAIARYYLFVKRLGEQERFKSYKVGDMTVARDIEKEFEIEKQMRQQALVDAACILKDGGFYFGAK